MRVSEGLGVGPGTHMELFGLPGRQQHREEISAVTGNAAGPAWPCVSPPNAEPVLSWELRNVAELPQVRAELRRAAAAASATEDGADLSDQLILAFDEMASNALRHGGGRVRAAVRATAEAYLIEVSDQAASAPPTPAVGRDPSEGGLGLYLIAELATQHGWYVDNGHKHVWALLPR
jgi:anti-sigma regulatory factor (Ser/Thr protein kinase)